MKKNRLLFGIFLLGSGMSQLYAQKMLYFNFKDKSQEGIAISDIRNLTFASGQVNVLKKNGTTESKTLTSIKFLSFGNGVPTGLSDNDFLSDKDRFSMFPNPVVNVLTIRYELPASAQVQIELLTLSGTSVYHHETLGQSGQNEVVWNGLDKNGEQLPAGTYVCQIKTADKVQSQKLIKN